MNSETKEFMRADLEMYKADAEELGVTLQEYLLYRVLDKLDDLRVTAYMSQD